MVYQALQSFHTVKEDGVSEEFVPKGKVFPDGHVYVTRDQTGTLFEKLELSESQPKTTAAKKA